MRLKNVIFWGVSVTFVFSTLVYGEEPPTGEYRSGTVSPKKAFLLSLLVPGSGQLYAGEKRGIVPVAIEAVVWPVYFTWKHKGKKIEKDYQRFADQHWEFDRYKQWRDMLESGEKSKLTHNYEQASKQQKYEMIGKYDQFVFGWDDSKPSIEEVQRQGLWREYPPDSLKNVHSVRRLKYMDMRYKSNKYLRHALWCTGVLLANHILSAIDAAHCAQLKKEGLSLEKRTQVRVAMKFEAGEAVPVLCFLKRF